MKDLIEVCQKDTGRTYPQGYGFALAYLTGDPGVYELKIMRERAGEIAARWIKATAQRRPPYGADVLRYVAAMADQPMRAGWTWWLIEAAQLVLADAIAGNEKSAYVMRRWQHPGY